MPLGKLSVTGESSKYSFVNSKKDKIDKDNKPKTRDI